MNLASLAHFEFGNEIVEIPTPFAKFTGVADADVFTETKLASTLDFSAPVETQVSGCIEFSALISGTINCVRLENIVEMVPEVNFHTSDSLLPITFMPLREPVSVQSGQALRLTYSYSHRSAISEAFFEVEILET